MTTRLKVASGILSWPSTERVSDRYGVIYPSDSTFSGKTVNPLFIDHEALSAFNGKWVCLICVVREARLSGHCGDREHGLTPVTPFVGDEVKLAIGRFSVGRLGNGAVTFEINPEDGRTAFWIEPLKLYKLHDQTVDWFIHETTEHPFEAWKPCASEPAIWSVGDGHLQVKQLEGSIRVKNNVEFHDHGGNITLSVTHVGVQSQGTQGHLGNCALCIKRAASVAHRTNVKA